MCSEANLNTNLSNIVQDLREQLSSEGYFNDNFNIEKCLLELKTELHIKRDKVKQSRTELELAIYKVNDLKQELNTAHQQYKDRIVQLNILTKKTKSMEEELNEKRDTVLKVEMQHKMTTGELDTLKSNLQTSELEKRKLTKKFEDFKTTQRYNSNYQSEILKGENSMRNLIQEIETKINKLKLEQHKFKEQRNRTQSVVNSKIILNNLERKYDDLKKEKEVIDDLYVHMKAKVDKIEEFISSPNQSVYQPNTITKYNYTMWKDARSRYEKELLDKNELLLNLQQAYDNEKMLKIKIMSQKKQQQVKNETLKQENYDLNIKIKRLFEEFGMENDDGKESGDQAEIKTDKILIPD